MKPTLLLSLAALSLPSARAEVEYIRRLGLFGTEFTRSSDNYQSSTVTSLTNSGYAGGYSTRYNGATPAGRAAWVTNISTGTTTRVGLTSGEFGGDYQSSTLVFLTEGHIRQRAISMRYEGSGVNRGRSWVEFVAG